MSTSAESEYDFSEDEAGIVKALSWENLSYSSRKNDGRRGRRGMGNKTSVSGNPLGLQEVWTPCIGLHALMISRFTRGLIMKTFRQEVEKKCKEVGTQPA